MRLATMQRPMMVTAIQEMTCRHWGAAQPRPARLGGEQLSCLWAEQARRARHAASEQITEGCKRRRVAPGRQQRP